MADRFCGEGKNNMSSNFNSTIHKLGIADDAKILIEKMLSDDDLAKNGGMSTLTIAAALSVCGGDYNVMVKILARLMRSVRIVAGEAMVSFPLITQFSVMSERGLIGYQFSHGFLKLLGANSDSWRLDN